jgi:AcrR family transcriptional regulator
MNSSTPTTELRILQRAEELFRRYGIKNVTMDEIARHLGVSKKTIYQFYDDKNKMVLSLVQQEILCHNNQFEDFRVKSKNAIEEILHIMQYMSGMFAKTNPNLFIDMQRYHPDAWQEFRNFKEKNALEQVIRNLERGREEGLYRNDFSIKILARLRLEEIEMAMNPMIYPPDKFSIHEVQIQVLDHFLHGICTLRGHKMLNKYKQIQEEED